MTHALAVALLISGCAGTIRSHPFASVAVANTAIVVGAGVCAIECGGGARGVSEGVLIGELAVSSAIAWIIAGGVTAYATEHR